MYFLNKTVDSISKTETIKQTIQNAIGKHSNIDQKTQIKTNSLTMTMVKSSNVSNNSTIFEGLGKTNVPSVCKLNPETCNNANITMAVSGVTNKINLF